MYIYSDCCISVAKMVFTDFDTLRKQLLTLNQILHLEMTDNSYVIQL
jgi:hypothetical protein